MLLNCSVLILFLLVLSFHLSLLSLICMVTRVSFGADLNLESPCLKKTCEFGAACVVKNGEAVCECSDACPQDQDPVCGSDGHTYGSSCQMKAMGCALQKQIQIQHKGPCGEYTHRCHSLPRCFSSRPPSALKHSSDISREDCNFPPPRPFFETMHLS